MLCTVHIPDESVKLAMAACFILSNSSTLTSTLSTDVTSLFQMQNDAVLVDVLLQVSDQDAVQHGRRTCLQTSATHEPLLTD